MDTDGGSWLEKIISDFVKDSPENSLKMETEEKAWDEVLVGFSSGGDPLYDTYKDVVGEDHWTPLEALSKKFPDLRAAPGDLTVISWVLPQRGPTKEDNRKESFYPSRRWVQARFPGEEFNSALRNHVVRELALRGIQSVAPLLLPEWKWVKSSKFVYTSYWSERHAAYAAGLGTFGLCDGLITAKGKAHRTGSVVANLKVSPSPRPYQDHHAYCLFYYDGSCDVCQKRCPVDAITDKGHDKVKCWDHAGGTCARFVKENYGFDGYGCGLCQTGVPCESGIPKKILKSMEGRQTP
jgi:epoxyqueuosine reductase